MRHITIFSLLLFAFTVASFAQTNPAPPTAQEILATVRTALGGEANLTSIRGFSLAGNYRHFTPNKEVKGEIKIDWLAPDKFLKLEKSELQPAGTLSLTQVVNGKQVWVERQINRPSLSDESTEKIGVAQTTTPVQVTTSTMGMRDTVNGTTTIRNTPPGARPTERSVLGMSLPTAAGGQERDTPLEKLDEAQRAAKQQPVKSNRPPGLEDPEIKAAMERQFRRDFICLSFVMLQNSPVPLEFPQSEIIKTPDGKMIAALEMKGPEDFAARLFIDQASHRPMLISYRELVNPNAGYVTSNQTQPPADLQEIAVQFYFSDYRQVNNVWLPFQITKAINGVPLDEWKLEKYKLNPDLKAKKFEKK